MSIRNFVTARLRERERALLLLNADKSRNALVDLVTLLRTTKFHCLTIKNSVLERLQDSIATLEPSNYRYTHDVSSLIDLNNAIFRMKIAYTLLNNVGVLDNKELYADALIHLNEAICYLHVKHDDCQCA